MYYTESLFETQQKRLPKKHTNTELSMVPIRTEWYFANSSIGIVHTRFKEALP